VAAAVEPLLEELLEVEALVAVATGHWRLWVTLEPQIQVAVLVAVVITLTVRQVAQAS
jgi:hypothetical protein